MKYRMKKGEETFTIVDGPFAGRSYMRGVEYDEIPAGYGGRFEKVEPVAVKKASPDPVKSPAKSKKRPADAGKEIN